MSNKTAGMTFKSAFADVVRSFDYLRDVRLVKGGLHIRRTGAEVKLDGSFFRSSLSVLEIYSYLVGLRLLRLARFERPAKTISFFPQQAAPWYNIWSVIQIAGYKIIDDPEQADIVFIFEDSTYSNAASKVVDGGTDYINARCTNIAKQYVADLFEEVFGYNLKIDPITHQGIAMRKSQHNGVHDGVVIQCPIDSNEVLPGYVYQKLVNNSDDGEKAQDLRIVYVMGEIPVVFHKYKTMEKRFGTDYLSVSLKEARDVFSQQEVSLICTYCEKIGLDFGAVDIMRDRDDGRIYIVDVNKTCMPVLTLPLGKQIEAFRRMSDAFSMQVKNRDNR